MNARLGTAAALRAPCLSAALTGLPSAAWCARLNDDIGNALPVPVAGRSTTIDPGQTTAAAADPACGGPVLNVRTGTRAQPVFVSCDSQGDRRIVFVPEPGYRIETHLAADVGVDLFGAKAFTTGPVTLEPTGFDFDAPYEVQAIVDGQVVRR